MAIEEGVVLVGVKPDLTNFGKEVGTGVTKSVGGIKNTIGSIGKTIGVTIGAAYAVSFAKQAIGAAEEARKIAAQTDAVLKSTGGAANVTADQVSGLAQSISDITAVDDEAIQKGENLLLTFTNIRNEAGAGNDIFNQSTEIMVDLAAAMGTDVSGGAIQLGKALNDPVKGITALTRVGVTFSDEQKKQIEQFTKENDLVSAQKVILAELKKEFGGSAEAQATGLDRLKLKWGNFQEAVGAALLPIVDFAGENTALVLTLVGAGGLLFAVVKITKAVRALADTYRLLRDAQATQAIVSGITGVTTAFAGMAAAAGVSTLAAGGLVTAALGAGLAIGTLLNETLGISDFLAEHLVPNTENSAEAIDKQSAAYQEVNDAAKAGTITQEDYTAKINALNEEYGAGIDPAAAYAMLTDDVGEASAESTKKVKHLGAIVGMNSKKWKEWKTATHESLEGFVGDIQQGERIYSGSANSFIRDLRRQRKAYSNYADDIGSAEDILKGKHQNFLASLEQDPNKLHAFIQADKDERRTWIRAFNTQADAHKDAEGAIDSTQRKVGAFSQNAKADVEGVTGKVQDLHGELKGVSAAPYDVTINYKTSNMPPQPGGFDGNPKTPYPAAMGGVYHARPGGYIVRVAEAGRDEVITPVGKGASVGGGAQNINVTVSMDDSGNLYVKRAILEEMDRQAAYDDRISRTRR